jgi:heme/copper-type cytochrome/quinol oxidase subunit 3
MNAALQIAVVVTKTVILVLGGTITYFAYKASQRTRTASLRTLSLGFGVITVGAVFGGVAHQFVSASIASGVLINSILTAVGFVIITYSLYME